MIANVHKIGCMILAAGLSSRMGTSKALLKYDAEHRFIDRIISVYRKIGIENITVVTNDNLKNELNLSGNINLVINNHQKFERFYSVKSACDTLQMELEYCFIQNCDNPFVRTDLLEQLISEKDNSDSIIPAYQNQGGHPILINRKIVDYIKSIDGKNENLREVLSKFRSRKINTFDETVIININTSEDYKYYFETKHD